MEVKIGRNSQQEKESQQQMALLMHDICAPHSLHNALLNAKVKVFIQNPH